jgi:hypothetical protein
MRGLATLLGTAVCLATVGVAQTRFPIKTEPVKPASSVAPCIGKWLGFISTGPSKIAQTMDGDQLYKLQVSKGFMKSVQYQFDFLPDGTFKSVVSGPEISRRRSRGNWSLTGNLLKIDMTQDNGAKTSRQFQAMLSSDGKKFVIQIPSKPGIPFTKLIFKKVV